MKHCFTLLIFTLICTFGFAQNGKKMSTDHKNILKIGTETYFNGDEFPFSISWETKIAARQSLQFGFLPRVLNDDFGKTNGVGLFFGYRKYISKGRTGLQGLYFSPSIKFGYLQDKYTYTSYSYPNPTGPPVYTEFEVKDKITTAALGFTFGKQWVYKSGFALDIAGGLGYFSNNVNTNNYNRYRYRNGATSGISPNLTIKIGYAF
jgi:hypothetical protein